MRYDYLIVGGGFFGARLAVELGRAGQQVLVLEREHDLMQRASYANQARVHGGYHYPRSLLTALRSRVNLPVFSEEYADCIDDRFEKYYAIATNFTKVNGEQFRMFCERIEAPIRRAPEKVQMLFNADLVEAVFTVEEYAFDAVKIKQRLIDQLAAAGVEVRTGTEARRVKRGPQGLIVELADGGGEQEVEAGRVLNCTYARINELNRASGLPEIPLKHEIAEICLIDPPEELGGKGVTVMCGPFFSAMPFPARGKYSFTHVRYTPHTEWHEGMGGADASDAYAYLERLTLNSAYIKMLADAKRYLPSLAKAHYVESLYEVKTVLPQSEGDDSRPILYKEDYGLPGYTCIMGGKLDNIYDVFKELSRNG
ncbi:MAG: FAD-dependent oxidoreductase [Candidatus Saccharibacteria bacterium]|jgi:glycine/D-amino acid oxidase-like deaminating enzyme|nr:FAD-dependent oxidoreductase [Candidatus Saccharibacteria bacterium]